MKKILSKILLVIMVFSLTITSISFAGTKEDIISALNKTYTISEGKTYKLPKKYIKKGTDFLNEHDLSSEQCDVILECIDEALALAREAGHTDIKKLTKEQYAKGLTIILKAARVAKVNINEEIKKEQEERKGEVETISNTNMANTVIEDNAKTEEKSPVNNNTQNGDKVENNDVVNVESGDNSVSGENQKEENTLSTSTDPLPSNDDKEIDIEGIVTRNMLLVLIGLVALIFLNIFLIRLIFKKKWLKIVKYILIILLTLFLIVDLILFGLLLYYFDEIKMIYELYYLFK